MIGTLTRLAAASLALGFATAVQGTTDNVVVPIAGGKFEASGVVAAGNGVLFVDDGRADRVFWMELDPAGRQVGRAEGIPLGVTVPDMEGITTDGTYFYVVGSQSKKDWQSGAGLARFNFDARTKQVSDVQSLSGLRQVVLNALPDVARAAGSKVDGFNIEGLAWDHARQHLWLALREPVRDGQALIIPLKLRDPAGRLESANIVVGAGEVVTLPLGGGIRSIEYDSVTKGFRIITDSSDSSFTLWRWSGEGTPERESLAAPAADRKAKPEGITRVVTGNTSYTFIVFDTSSYTAIRADESLRQR